MKQKGNISVILILGWVFLFPPLYQSLHNISHHLNSENHHKSLSNTVQLEAYEASCPILTYEASTLDLPSVLQKIISTSDALHIYTSNYINPFLNADFGIYLLRAPPQLVF